MAYKPVKYTEKVRARLLSNPDSHAAYEAARLEYEAIVALRHAREKRKMTLREVAEIMHTHAPVVSRLESSGEEGSRHSPSLLTLAKYADAVGCRIRLSIVPLRKSLRKAIPLHPQAEKDR